MKTKLALFILFLSVGITGSSVGQDQFRISTGSGYYITLNQATEAPAGFTSLNSLDDSMLVFGSMVLGTANVDDLTDSQSDAIDALEALGVSFYENVSTGEIVYILPSSSSGYEASPNTGFSTTAEFFALAPELQNAAISTVTSDVEPDPQGTTQRTTQGMRSGAIGRLGGIHAGVEAPELADVGGDSLHFEYGYIDASLDNPGVGIASETNVYALGYERYLGRGIYLDVTYEYADNQLQAGALGINGDSHTVAASLSADLVNNIYGILIVGNSWSNGSTNLGGAQVVGSNGSTFFINPGLGTSWAFGDVIVDSSVSYLYQNGTTSSTVGGVKVGAGAQLDQVIVDLGATYNFTDSIYARLGVQYNNIVADNLGAAIPIDENWVQINSEIGARIGANSNVFVGHSYDAGHNIYDIHTYRAGFSYGF